MLASKPRKKYTACSAAVVYLKCEVQIPELSFTILKVFLQSNVSQLFECIQIASEMVKSIVLVHFRDCIK